MASTTRTVPQQNNKHISILLICINDFLPVRSFVADIMEKSSFFLREHISLNSFLPKNILGRTSQKKPFKRAKIAVLHWLSFLKNWTLVQDFHFFIDVDVGVAIGIIENGKAMPLAVIFNLWHLFLYFLRTSPTKIVTLGSQQFEVLQCFNGKVVTWKLNSSAVQITCWSVHLYLLLSTGYPLSCLVISPNSKVSEHEPRTTFLLSLSLGLAPTPGLLAPPCQSGPHPVQAPHENPLPVKVLTSNKAYNWEGGCYFCRDLHNYKSQPRPSLALDDLLSTLSTCGGHCYQVRSEMQFVQLNDITSLSPALWAVVRRPYHTRLQRHQGCVLGSQRERIKVHAIQTKAFFIFLQKDRRCRGPIIFCWQTWKQLRSAKNLPKNKCLLIQKLCVKPFIVYF